MANLKSKLHFIIASDLCLSKPIKPKSIVSDYIHELKYNGYSFEDLGIIKNK